MSLHTAWLKIQPQGLLYLFHMSKLSKRVVGSKQKKEKILFCFHHFHQLTFCRTKRIKSFCLMQQIKISLTEHLLIRLSHVRISNFLFWVRFHQCSTHSFYACRSQKSKKILTTWLTLSGSTSAKAVRRTLMKSTPDENRTHFFFDEF
jgi:hypothetical protein